MDKSDSTTSKISHHYAVFETYEKQSI